MSRRPQRAEPGRAPQRSAVVRHSAPTPGRRPSALLITPAPAASSISRHGSRDGARGPFNQSPGGCIPATTAIAPLSDSRRRASSMPPPRGFPADSTPVRRHRRTVAVRFPTVATLQQLTPPPRSSTLSDRRRRRAGAISPGGRDTAGAPRGRTRSCGDEQARPSAQSRARSRWSPTALAAVLHVRTGRARSSRGFGAPVRNGNAPDVQLIHAARLPGHRPARASEVFAALESCGPSNG